MIVTGKSCSRYACMSSSSHAILSREYCQYGFFSGVDSVIGRCVAGVWYAEAELMKTYCRVLPAKNSTSACTWSGVNAIQFTTASNRWSPSTSARAARSDTSAWRRVTLSGIGLPPVVPRLSTVTSNPCSTASRTQEALMTPLPPMNSTLGPVNGCSFAPGVPLCTALLRSCPSGPRSVTVGAHRSAPRQE